ncbi:hypothetical protein [Aquamicrobium sp. LC103]|uniref:hypothetical protein n=1 Tax=Aquamicrobium sp. LC103 TaxID=1120658 RepID=UPI00063EC669|nr:hypothetical protein [Aquamicrobium sp. LC103]TKT78430.1 hypothetical protein XW59_012505 [Aquamicrobium sp. LC103]
MRYLSPQNAAALAGRRLVARDFLWIVARDRSTGNPFPYGFWSDVGDVSAQVLLPETGVPTLRNFEGSGSLISVSDIVAVNNVTVRTVTVEMSQIDPAVENIVRGYDLKQAKVEIYRGLFSVSSRQLVAPAPCRFDGFVDEVEIRTPAENEAGSITLTCTSHTQEMTRANADTRSDDSQRKRLATDNFFQDVSVVGDWEMPWGTKSIKVEGAAKSQQSTQVVLQGTPRK